MDKRPPIPIVRLAHPLGFRAYLHRVGLNPDVAFRKCGLPTMCDDTNAYVPLYRAWRFFAWAAGEMEPSVGWRVLL